MIERTFDLLQHTFDFVERTFDVLQHTFDFIERTFDSLNHTFDSVNAHLIYCNTHLIIVGVCWPNIKEHRKKGGPWIQGISEWR